MFMFFVDKLTTSPMYSAQNKIHVFVHVLTYELCCCQSVAMQ